ncbi:MAG: OmpA family protein [Bacteroidales bacterium]|nr:OmpA family protein [Bacteroidales bacterium]
MKGLKSIIAVLCLSIGVSSCNYTQKGLGIGAAAGTAAGAGLGALVGKLTGNTKMGAIIGAAAGAAVGTTAGGLIGRKMDKAAAAAAAVANAEVSTITDKNGLEAVKVTFDNGILFQVGKANLQSAAQSALKQFANNVLNVYTDCDVAICGYASSDGSEATNLTLSQNRANAVKAYLTGTCGVSNAQIKGATGYGENPEYLIYDANGKEDMKASRRVEVYLYASQAMIEAANNGTLK